MSRNIWFVRHAQSEYNQKKLFRVDMIAHDKNKRIHIGFNAFKMNIVCI